ALGDAGYLFGWIRRVFPQIGFMRFPIKFVIPAIFMLPLLAAFGAREVLCKTDEGKGRPWRLLALIAFVFLVLILLLLWVARLYPIDQRPWIVTAENGLMRGVFLAASLGALYGTARIQRSRGRWLSGLGLLVLLWLDVVTHAPPQNPTVPRSVYEPGLQPLQELKPRPRLGESRAMPSF